MLALLLLPLLLFVASPVLILTIFLKKSCCWCRRSLFFVRFFTVVVVTLLGYGVLYVAWVAFFVTRQHPRGGILAKPEPCRVQRAGELVRHQRPDRHSPLRVRVRAYFRCLYPRLPDEDGQETDELLQDAGAKTTRVGLITITTYGSCTLPTGVSRPTVVHPYI